ncbi:hypothetical protein [Bacteroides faecichinchillae]|uniref:hypothetical protein n=1 Tax=Bacteroides faecichinchillae TaxID=871325 RepID=UPI0011147725|nr:hypothetical protein [Bacteroides faecichinchillae]
MTKEPKPDYFTDSSAARVRLVIPTALSSTRAILSCDMGGVSSLDMVRISSFLFISCCHAISMSNSFSWAERRFM